MQKTFLFFFLSFFLWNCREKEQAPIHVIVDELPPEHHYTAFTYHNAELKPGKNGWVGLDSGSATIYRFVHSYSTPKLHDSGASIHLLFAFKNLPVKINRDYFFQNSKDVEAYAFFMASFGPDQKLEALRGCFRVLKYSPDTLAIHITGKAEGDRVIRDSIKTEIIAEDTTLVFTLRKE